MCLQFCESLELDTRFFYPVLIFCMDITLKNDVFERVSHVFHTLCVSRVSRASGTLTAWGGIKRPRI